MSVKRIIDGQNLWFSGYKKCIVGKIAKPVLQFFVIHLSQLQVSLCVLRSTFYVHANVVRFECVNSAVRNTDIGLGTYLLPEN